MLTLDRYVMRLFSWNLVVALGILVGLYGLIEFLDKVDNFIESGAALNHYLRYPLYKLPLMVSQTLPMAILLGTFATIGHLSRTHQMTALRSGGISLWQTTRPLFFIGVFFSIIMLAGNGWVAPWSSREARYILDTEIKKKPEKKEVTQNLYLRDGQRILSIAHAYPQHGEITGLVLLEFDPDFKLARRLDAQRGSHQGNNSWLLYTVVERRFNPKEGRLTGFSKTSEQLVDLGRGPLELSETSAEPAELSFSGLIATSERLQNTGQDPQRYQSELHFRIAQSLMPLIVVLLGVPFALQRGRQATLGVGVAMSLGVFVAYLVMQAVGMALGTIGLLPLPIAAWAANVLLMLVGSWLFLTLDT